ncbi:MAG: hypothetical protein Q7T57_07245, partial [Dehalococcoidales bacterium]|nr:hypothetical protein [Dehalococcoidales bacterium]
MQGVIFALPVWLFDIPWIVQQNTTESPNTLEHVLYYTGSASAVPTRNGGSIMCQSLDQRNSSYLCQPTQNGKRVFGSDLDAPLPDLTDPNVWGYQATLDHEADLCIGMLSFVDMAPVRAYYNTSDTPYQLPFLGARLMNSREIVGVNAITDVEMPRTRDRYVEVLNNNFRMSYFDFNAEHITSLSLSKYTDVHSNTKLTFAITDRDVFRMSPTQVELSFQTAVQDKPPEVVERITKYRTNPNVEMFSMQFCLRPAALTAIVSTELTPYGILPFLSDLGGFLNLAFILVTLLFPIVARIHEPRKFLAFVIHTWWTNRQNKQEGDEFDLATIGATTTTTT